MTACSSGGSSGGTSGSGSGGHVTITVGCQPPKTQAPQRSFFLQDVKAFGQANPNVTVNGDDTNPCDDPTTFDAKLASGKMDSVFYTYFTDAANVISSGQAADIAPYAAQVKNLSSIQPDLVNLYRQGGSAAVTCTACRSRTTPRAAVQTPRVQARGPRPQPGPDDLGGRAHRRQEDQRARRRDRRLRRLQRGQQRTNFAGETIWVGLANYRHIIGDPSFWGAWRATAFFAGLALVFGYLVPFVTAVALNELRHCRGYFRLLVYLPVMNPARGGGLLVEMVLHPGQQRPFQRRSARPAPPTSQWLQSPHIAMLCLVLFSTWSNMGAAVLVYLASLQGIPGELYDAAEIDGAASWGGSGTSPSRGRG